MRRRGGMKPGASMHGPKTRRKEEVRNRQLHMETFYVESTLHMTVKNVNLHRSIQPTHTIFNVEDVFVRSTAIPKRLTIRVRTFRGKFKRSGPRALHAFAPVSRSVLDGSLEINATSVLGAFAMHMGSNGKEGSKRIEEKRKKKKRKKRKT